MQEIWETWFQPLGWEDPLEEKIATHSTILVWKIPWRKEPGKLQSVGSQSQSRLKPLSINLLMMTSLLKKIVSGCAGFSLLCELSSSCSAWASYHGDFFCGAWTVGCCFNESFSMNLSGHQKSKGLWYSHSMGNYTAAKINEIESHISKRINFGTLLEV